MTLCIFRSATAPVLGGRSATFVGLRGVMNVCTCGMIMGCGEGLVLMAVVVVSSCTRFVDCRYHIISYHILHFLQVFGVVKELVNLSVVKKFEPS